MKSRHHTFCINAFVLIHSSGITEAGFRVPDKPPDKLWPGDPRVIGPYRLIGRLGQGGMGDVFLGRSAGGRSVAVKVIRADFAADPEFRTRFRQEVAAARRVNGLYTAPVADADVDGPMPWLATAYVPGPSLATAVERYGPLPAGSVLALAAGLAEGLAAIHAVGLVHRDLKPSNVLLAADGPRVIDFGIARFTQSTGITRVGVVVGSPEFMSPEQAMGRVIGPPSDVFSLGAVLAFAATGRTPFDGHEPTELFDQIAFNPPDLAGVPASVRSVIEWCMAKAPRDRPTPQRLLGSLGEARLWDGWLPASLLADLPGGAPAPGPPAGRAERSAGPQAATRHDDTITTLSPVTPSAGGPPITVDTESADTVSTDTDSGQQPRQVRSTRARDAGEPAREPARFRGGRGRRRWLLRSPVALAVLAVAGVGAWLGLADKHGTGGGTPPSASVSSSQPPAFGPVSPVKYRLALAGATAGGCRTARASIADGRQITSAFTDKSTTQLTVDFVNYYNAARKQEFILKPGETRKLTAYVGDVWLITDSHGCVGTFTSTKSSHVTVESPAAPARP
jgi:serine/threonine protein kinase